MSMNDGSIAAKSPKPIEMDMLEEKVCIASGLREESDQRQISTLLYCLERKLTMFLTLQKRNDEDTQMFFQSSTIFFFHLTKNVIFERAQFNRHVQHRDKSAKQYIVALYNLAESENIKSKLIRAFCLVVGIRDMGLSERLQAD